MADCIFCKIIDRKAPALIVAETQDAIAFLPIEMETRGHTLIAPKRHFENLLDISPEASAAVVALVKSVARQYRDKIGATGENLLLASGRDAEQSVFHFHFHLLPRFPDDGLRTWPQFSEVKIDREAFLESVTR